MLNLYLSASAAIISFILLIEYFSKERVKIKENDVYLFMLIFVALDSIFVSGIYMNAGPGESVTLIKILNRCDYVVLIGWSSCLCRYAHAVIHKSEKEKYKRYQIVRRILTGIALTACVTLWFLRLDAVADDNGITAVITGPAVFFTYTFCAVFVVATVFIVLVNLNRVTKQIAPVFIFMGIAALVAISYYFNPGIPSVSMGLTIVNLTMYFTIENPDVRMLQRVNLAKDEAQRANQAKTDFLSSMSHEIRTPINAIMGLAECIQYDPDFDAAKADAKDIMGASQTLLEIINGILDISKIEAGKMEVVNKEYDLVTISETLVKLIKTRIGEKPIELRTKFSERIPGVLYGDEAKVRQVMTNFLTNAVKYTEKGHIDFIIDCYNTDNVANLTITISDTGHGIKEEELDRLFEKFQRLEEDRNSNVEGTGLGLAITKQFVEMLGGFIEVSSAYGKGSTFKVKLTQEIRSMERRAEDQEAASVREYPGHSILVVDDTQMNLTVAKRLLNRYKLDVDTAVSGEECIEKCKVHTYEIILLDDMMPKMSGAETLAGLKELPTFHTPVVAFTANAIDGMREAYLSSGYTDYLSKPLVKEELARVLERFIG